MRGRLALHQLEIVSGRQIRAARCLLGWEQTHLAKLSGVSLPTVCRMEKHGPQRSSLVNLLKVQEALKQGGIVFLRPLEQAGGMEGVRLRGDFE